MNSGIYEILNKVNGKKYIGSSKQLNKKRNEHFWALKRNKHYCKYLQYAWNKYGEENFEFIVIENIKQEFLINAEQYWLDYYWDSGLLYNSRPVADRNTGVKYTEEQKKRIKESWTELRRQKHSNRMKEAMTEENRKEISKQMQGNKNCVGNRLTKEHKEKCSVNSPNKKPVHQMDINTNEIIKTWTGVTTAARELGVSKGSILACARGKYTHGHGYKWQYVNN